MADFHFTRKAVEDLNSIWNYTFEKWSEKQADKFYKVILETCKDLANNPEMGKSYGKITPNLYGFKINLHIIFYRIPAEGRIEVARILHERMDLKNRIQE